MNGIDCLLLHVPHASVEIPTAIRGQFIIGDAELSQEINLMTDHFTDWLMAPLHLPPAQMTISPISRLVVDMERFADDKQEVMSKVGMGVIYTYGSQKQVIRSQLEDNERAALLSNYYLPHHNDLIDKTHAILEKCGKVLILDIHSYPSKALPYELDAGQIRPEICIGTDEYHTPITLTASAENAFKAKGFTCALNSPFAGTLIPSPFWKNNENVMGLMIEIRRDLYMDESAFQLKDSSKFVRKAICDAILDITHSLTDIKHDEQI
ncbi:MAG: N-formylglutamate deformylase [Psychroserpens sp.]|jgi:N-formylglutamate deformylase